MTKNKKRPNDKFNKGDFKNWKDHEFTKYFFSAIEKEIEDAEKGLVALCKKNYPHATIILGAKNITVLERIRDTDFESLKRINEKEEEDELIK